MRLMWLGIFLVGFSLSAQFYESKFSRQERKHFITLEYEQHTIIYDTLLKMPREVYYLVTSSSQSGSGRPRYFKKDPELDSINTLIPSDWDSAHAKLGYERGHLAPLGSLDKSGSYYELNYLSNICPQKGVLNGGPWRLLEEKVRSLAMDFDSVWVTTGTIFDEYYKPLPNCDKEHEVPSHFYKVITFWRKEGKVVNAFLMDQKSNSKDIYDYAVELEDLKE